jgi:O-antigen/teichoic acid export membrane protein
MGGEVGVAQGEKPITVGQTKGLSLKKNLVWITLGGATDLLCQWGLIALISRLMNVEAVGLYGLAMVIVTPLLAFANLGLREAQATDVRHNHPFGHYLTLRSLTNIAALFAIALAAWAMGLGPAGMTVVLLFGMARVIEAQSNAYHGLFQLRERMDFIAQSNVMRSLSALVFFTAGLQLGGDLRAGCLGLIAASLMTLIFNDIRRARWLQAHREGEGAASATRLVWDMRRLAKLAHHALPLGFVAVLSALQTNIPRFAIEHSLGLEALGYFTAVVAPYAAASRMATFLAQAASSRMAQRHSSGAWRDFAMLLAKMGGLGLAGGIAGVLIAFFLGREVLTLLYTPEYADYADLLLLAMIAALFRQVATMWHFGTIAARRFRLHLLQSVLVVISITAGSYLLIGPYGLWGAGVVLIVAGIVHFTVVATIAAIIVRDLFLENAAEKAD